ncbi:tigger transposable element-derived protein 7-like [Trichomycterus rosablanca]|uniref:tigger transposable element-derived protein 7-like n=1 Tax=Trichomycterus rosablanca TaxID=2290929 RepID=UPI002F358CFB
MASKDKVSGKRKRVHLGIAEKLELIKKVESGVSVASVCEEYGVRKQTVSDIRKSKEKLKEYSVKFSVEKNKDKKGVVHTRKHMKAPQSKELEEAVYKWYVQQRSVNVTVRGVEIKVVADELARHMGIEFKASDGWLWRFRNRHGLCNTLQHAQAGSADASANASAVELFRLKLNELIKTEDMHLSQVYNADETGLFWRSLPRNTQAFRNEDSIPVKKIIQDKFSALLGVNATGTHRLKPVVVGKSANPRCLKDCTQELPVTYYNSKNSWFTGAIFEDWFFNHFIPEVRSFQEHVLHLHPEDVKAILLLDNAPAHPHANKLVSADGKIRAVFLPPNTKSLIQPMDQGLMISCKRYYQRKYLDEVLVVLEDEEDLEEDRRVQRTLNNINNYNLKSAIYNFASSWRDVKITTLSNVWKKLLLDKDFECDFLGFEPQDFHQVLLCAGEKDVTFEDVENWLEDNDADPGYQMLSTEEIADAVLTDKDAVGDSSTDEEEEVVLGPKMSAVRESLDILISYVDCTDNREIQGYYGHLHKLRELVIRDQYQRGKQLKLDPL